MPVTLAASVIWITLGRIMPASVRRLHVPVPKQEREGGSLCRG